MSEFSQLILRTSSKFNWLSDSAYIRLSDAKNMLGTNSATIRRLVETKKVKTHQLTCATITYNVGDLRIALPKNS
jgi:hypothetical protein